MIECYFHEKVSPLEFWDVDILQEREAREIKSGGFESGKLLGMFVSIARNCDDRDDLKLKIKKIEDLLAVYGNHKQYLEKTIGLMFKENPKNLEIKGFVSKFECLFKENPIRLEENNVRGSKHEAECSKNVSVSNDSDINKTIMEICKEVGKIVKTRENEEEEQQIHKKQPWDRLGGYDGDVGHGFNKKKVEGIFNRFDMDAPSYKVGFTQDETKAGEMKEAEEYSNKNKVEGTLARDDVGGASYSSGLTLDELEIGIKQFE
ncbi:hypothetical protein L1987_54668 [Smallanthus sonchifolius]|uniref:Uncharacterized protein n=1 Tax=Smallanthus sonchifolius TaxID=185202 RepID=A0ACB9E7V4_9ASTR|nr:hypothetical protein L1987_54668 [Smallanthus sonchifolius]